MKDPLYRETLTAEDFRRVRQVFEAVLDRPMEQQKAFLEGACAGDIALRREVERMLAAERGSDPILDAIAPIRTTLQRASPRAARRLQTTICPTVPSRASNSSTAALRSPRPTSMMVGLGERL